MKDGSVGLPGHSVGGWRDAVGSLERYTAGNDERSVDAVSARRRLDDPPSGLTCRIEGFLKGRRVVGRAVGNGPHFDHVPANGRYAFLHFFRCGAAEPAVSTKITASHNSCFRMIALLQEG